RRTQHRPARPRPQRDAGRRATGTLVPYGPGKVRARSSGIMRTMRTRPGHMKPRRRVARRAAHPKASPVRIVVADSQAIDRGGLVGLLEDEPDFEVVGEAATVEEAIRQCSALEPGVLVLSLNLPGQKENAAIPAIRAQLPALRIVALSERG